MSARPRYAWDNSIFRPGPRTIVQSMNNVYETGAVIPVTNWQAPPTRGHLLLCLVGTYEGIGTVNLLNGWQMIENDLEFNWFVFAVYKYVTGSVPLSEQIVNYNSPHFNINGWEIAGVTGNINIDLVKYTYSQSVGSVSPATSQLYNALVTQNKTGLVLASNFGNGNVAPPFTSTWTGGGFTKDLDFMGNTRDVTNSLFDWCSSAHQSVVGGATVQPTVSYNPTVINSAMAYFELPPQ